MPHQFRTHFTTHLAEYVFAVLIVFAVAGVFAELDRRHISQEQWLRSEIRDKEQEIEKLKLYNKFGTKGNQPARDQVILTVQNRKNELLRDLEALQN